MCVIVLYVCVKCVSSGCQVCHVSFKFVKVCVKFVKGVKCVSSVCQVLDKHVKCVSSVFQM